MKKKCLLFIVLVLFLCNIDAKEVSRIGDINYSINNIEYYCDGEKYYLENFLDNTNKYIITNGENEKLYRDGKCYDLTIQDKLDINNDIVDYYYITDEDGTTDFKIYDTYYNYREGFVLNTEEYNENETYYIYNDESFDQVSEIDKDKIKEYYVFRYFKSIPKAKLIENTNYYVDVEESELFVLNTDKNNEDYLNLYEIISYDKLFTNERKYTFKETDIQNIISKNEIDEEEYVVDGTIINDKVYYTSIKYDDDYNTLSIKYYSADGKEVFSNFNNRLITTYGKYNFVEDLEYKDFEIYDADFNLITKYSFDFPVTYNFINNDEDAYVIFVDENNNSYNYLIDSEYNVEFCYYFTIIGLIVLFIIAYGIYKNKTK